MPAGPELGKAPVARNGCASCNSTADEDYLRESILEPDARIVRGVSSGIMPQRSGDRLSESDVDAVIQYIEAIR